ncbi:unnamed protein product [Sphagnum jensenii]|uniref:Uncharacterized protein n=1 Tax=Sphagnum jensenii TaxID=128206 RepID=A0ABP1C235_9BRYO
MESEKVYVHYQGHPEFTYIAKLDPLLTVAQLAQDFATAYRAKYGLQHMLDLSCIEVFSERHKPLMRSMVLKKVAKNRSDLFIELRAPELRATSLSPEEKVEIASAKQKNKCLEVPWEVLSSALEAQRAKNYKCAGKLFREVLNIVPDQRICLRGLGSMALAVCKFDEAMRWLHRGVVVYPNDALFHARIADAYSGKGDYEAALAHYDCAVGLVLEMVDYPIAGDLQGAVCLESLKVASARVFLKLGEESTAYDLLMTVLKDDSSHWGALYEYSLLALRHGFTNDALQILLKLLVAMPENRDVRSHITSALQQPQGMDILKQQLSLEPANSPAVAALASCIKDFGAIDEATQLYELALSLTPYKPSYVLNLIHLLEVSNKYLSALDKATAFCHNLPDFHVGGLQLSDVKPYLVGLPIADNESHVRHCMGAELLRLDGQPPGDDERGANGAERGNLADHDPKVMYSGDQLDTLAILFVIVKILYLGGALQRSKSLAVLVESAVLTSIVPLHHTLVRNEAAYFGCIHQILQEYPIPLPLPSREQLRPLYLAGDSHCLSAAWRTVQLREEARLLVPLLVTGLKVWHLREESRFYPKVAFQTAMESLPQDSQVIMLFGEIDCREGILVSVEKCRYENVEEGVEASVHIYLQQLLRLIQDCNFEIFVHPVSPVLSETRAVVHIFNHVLQTRLHEAQQTSPCGKQLHWLDFFPDLLTPDGELRDEFKLDGTHLNPNYVTPLARALAKVE